MQGADLGGLSRGQVDLTGAGIELGVLGLVVRQGVVQPLVDGIAVLG